MVSDDVDADDASFLVLLLESSPCFWRQLTSLTELTPQSYIEQILAFINAYLMLNDANRLAVFAAGVSSSYLLYQTPNCLPNEGADAMSQPGAGAGPGAAILAGLQVAMKTDAQAAAAAAAAAGATTAGAAGPDRPTALSSALSRVLCFVHRVQRLAAASSLGLPALAPDVGVEAAAAKENDSRRAGQPRVLCMLGCPDAPSQYIAVMNAIFSAQRSGGAIDGLMLGSGHSAFLQQAAHLTGGAYLRPAHPEALTQYLLSVYAADPFSRRFLRLPRPSSVDLRASCFCHKQPVDLGYVCSVCLSIFCQPLPSCTTCGTPFLHKGGGTGSGGGGRAVAA